MIENKSELYAFIIEFTSFLAVVVLLVLDADIKTIIAICTVYLSAVIRNAK